MKETALSYINDSALKSKEAFINSCEAQFDNQLNATVEKILANRSYDIVMLAGPSSSGKTTTAFKLAQKIRQSGKNAFTVSLDDFYLNRDDIPFGEDGLRDFENVTALDLELINRTFSDLIEKRRAELPVFDFKTGKRSTEAHLIELSKDDIIIVEGLHALNPLITQGLDSDHLFKIYISVSSRVLDGGDILLTKRNLRLVRRMLRDSRHRNVSAEQTLRQWQSVLNGEDKYIFPFEAYADIKVDSFHDYEPCMFKKDVLLLLDTVKGESEFYKKAQELKHIYHKAEEIDSKLLPNDSLLCEFMC